MAEYQILDERDRGDLLSQITANDIEIRDIKNNFNEYKIDAAAIHKGLQDDIDNAKGSLSEAIETTNTNLTKYINEQDDVLQEQITTNINAIASNLKEIARVEGERKDADNALDTRLKVVEEDVNTFLADADLTETAKDTLREIQDYIDSDVDAAATMTANIQANATAITNEQARATGVESGLNTRLTTAEGEIDKLQEQDITLQSNIDTLRSDLETDIGNFTEELNNNIVELRNTKVNVSDIVDNLTSTDTAKPLSANQGYVLNDSINSLSTELNNSINSLDTELNNSVSSLNEKMSNYLPLTGGTVTGDVALSESDLYADDLYVTDLYFAENGGAMGQIYGKTPEGNYIANIQPCNESGNCVIGFGIYENGSGNVNIYGADGINMVLTGCTGRVFNARNDYGNMEINRSGHVDKNSKTYIYGTDVHLVTVDGYEAYKNEMPIVANKVLYSDSTGTAGEVTLSETAANFDYLEVYVKADGLSSSVKVCDPDGSTVAAHVHGGDAAGDCLFYGSWTVNETTMTCNVNNTYNYADGTYAPTATNELYIVKVVGYK